MFLLKIKCSEVKATFSSEGAEAGTKADMFTASAASGDVALVLVTEITPVL